MLRIRPARPELYLWVFPRPPRKGAHPHFECPIFEDANNALPSMIASGRALPTSPGKRSVLEMLKRVPGRRPGWQSGAEILSVWEKMRRALRVGLATRRIGTPAWMYEGWTPQETGP